MINKHKQPQLFADSRSLLRSSVWCCVAMVVFLIGMSGCASDFVAEPPEYVQIKSLNEEEEKEAVTLELMSRAQLRDEIQRFAYRYYGRLNPLIDDVMDKTTTPEQRLRAHEWKAQISFSLIEITISENSESALLDMLVLVTLVRAVSEERLVPQVFYGDNGQKWLTAVRLSENEIWSLAEKILKPEQQVALRKKISEWHVNNPDKENVTSVRFSDFAEEISHDDAESLPQAGGLLPEVSEATRAVDEIRRASERAMFLAMVSPIMARLEAERLIYRLATQPEAKEYRSSLEKFSAAAAKLSATSDRFPGLVASEREAAVDQAIDRLLAERENLFAEIDTRSSQLKELLGQIQEIATTGDSLAGEVADSMTTIDSLVTKLGLDKPGHSIEDYRATLVEAAGTAGEINKVILSLERLLYIGLDEKNEQTMAGGLLELERRIERWIWWEFIALAGLVLFTAVVTVCASLTYRWLIARIGKTS